MLVLGLAAALSACGGGDDDETELPSSTSPSVTTTVGAAGGTVVGPDDVRIVIPAGALSADTAITVRKSFAGAPALPASAAGAKPAMYEITPHGLHFDAPVTISMASTLDPAVDPVLMAQPGEPWQLVTATAEGGRVSWSTTHFSWTVQYPCTSTWPPGTPLPPNGPPACQFPGSDVEIAATPASAMTRAGVTKYGQRVSAAADVTVTFSYSAPLGCIDPQIRTWRLKRPASLPSQITTTPVALALTAVPGVPGASRLTGSTDIPYRFEYADNGTHETGYYFACQNGFTVGGNVQFVVQVAQPPAMPAAPTITAQPAHVSVVVGATAAFDVLAAAPDNLVVRWERREPGAAAFVAVAGASPIAGGSRLSVVTQAVDTGASYRATVCNALNGLENCISSSVAALTVTTPTTAPLASGGILSGSNSANCAITADRRVLCWGYNLYLALGNGTIDEKAPTPAPVVGLVDASYVSSGLATGCAVYGGGRMACWGTFPPYANGGTATPIHYALTDVVKVYADNATVCWIRADGRAYCNGAVGAIAADGQVIEGVVEITRRDQDLCLLDGVGTVRCLTSPDGSTFATLFTEPGVKAMGRSATFAKTVCFVMADATIKCRGSDQYGQFGQGSVDLGTESGAPIGVAGVTSVAVGARHACAVVAMGRVMCWGSGTGILGDGQGFVQGASPAAVPGLDGIVAVAAGFDLSCALRGDGQVLCWGPNESGQIGTGAIGAPVLVPTATVAGAVFAH